VSNLGRVAYFQQDYQQARTLLSQALEVIREGRLRGWPLADSLDWLAAVTAARGDTIRAARLFGAAEAQWLGSGAVRYAPDQPIYEGEVASVRSQLHASAFEAAWAEGRVMNAEQVITYALEEARPELRPNAASAVDLASDVLEGTGSTGDQPAENVW
jgi:hypothetical protein